MTNAERILKMSSEELACLLFRLQLIAIGRVQSGYHELLNYRETKKWLGSEDHTVIDVLLGDRWYEEDAVDFRPYKLTKEEIRDEIREVISELAKLELKNQLKANP